MATIEIGRFDGELKKLVVDDKTTISKALDMAGLKLASGEEVNTSRAEAKKGDDRVDDGEQYLVVGNYKSG